MAGLACSSFLRSSSYHGLQTATTTAYPARMSTCLSLLVLACMIPSAIGGSIGVDIGLNGNNIIPPKQIVSLLSANGIDRARIYDANASVLQAFARSGIDLIVGVPNEDVPTVAKGLDEAKRWVRYNIVPYSGTRISAILVGNEWLSNPSLDPTLLVPAIRNINSALTCLGLARRRIKVSTAHSLNVLSESFPPSIATFKEDLTSILKSLIDFLRQTGSFFMANIVPYFAYINDPNVSLEFALFENCLPIRDNNTNLLYYNLFDLQLDAVYSAIAALESMSIEYGTDLRQQKRIDTKSGESGWPSDKRGSGSVPSSGFVRGYAPASSTGVQARCECDAATIENAQIFNQNLIVHVLEAEGTPLYPSRPITAYIFALFDENLKNGSFTEQEYGLFHPDGKPKYPIDFCPY